MAKKSEKGSWLVRMECVVIKEYILNDCTEDQAKTKPFDQDVVDEIEESQIDWKVLSVKPNE